MKKAYAALFFLLVLCRLPAQDFSRLIQLQTKRMNGPDIAGLQRRLLALGFTKTGPADGWYGPLTEGSVRTAQYFLGFPQDGRVSGPLWTALFNTKEDALLKSIGVISSYNQSTFVITQKRNGSTADFDDFLFSSVKDEVKTVLFQHINEGLPVFRFMIYCFPDALFMVQDVYYGAYKTRVYFKNAQGFFEVKNGEKVPADPALEGILNRVRDGMTSTGLHSPVLAVPAAAGSAPQPSAPDQSAEPVPPAGPAPADPQAPAAKP